MAGTCCQVPRVLSSGCRVGPTLPAAPDRDAVDRAPAGRPASSVNALRLDIARSNNRGAYPEPGTVHNVRVGVIMSTRSRIGANLTSGSLLGEDFGDGS